jgi:hypothetical protein
VGGIEPFDFRCGHCGREVASNQGFQTQDAVFKTYVCPRCNKTTFTTAGQVVPGAPFGNEVGALPEAIEALYREARNAVQASAYTAAVLTCRKILMHVAVAQGAEAGKSFISYVEYLADKGYVPPNGRAWVDHIRNRGNEANHEITVMNQQDAAELVIFVEMLLKFVYELPSLVPAMPEPS